MSLWGQPETILASKLNQKELFIGATAPASPTNGQLWYDTVNKLLKYYDVSAWKTVELLDNKNAVNGYPGLDGSSFILKARYNIIKSTATQNYNDTTHGTSNTAYVKLKEMKINEALPVIFVMFSIRSNNASQLAYGMVYKNGAGAGPEHSTTATIDITFMDQIGAWAVNDLCQIYGKATSGYQCWISNQRLGYAVDIVRSVTNQDP